jgi:hypothetical protein
MIVKQSRMGRAIMTAPLSSIVTVRDDKTNLGPEASPDLATDLNLGGTVIMLPRAPIHSRLLIHIAVDMILSGPHPLNDIQFDTGVAREGCIIFANRAAWTVYVSRRRGVCADRVDEDDRIPSQRHVLAGVAPVDGRRRCT